MTSSIPFVILKKLTIKLQMNTYEYLNPNFYFDYILFNMVQIITVNLLYDNRILAIIEFDIQISNDLKRPDNI